MAGVQLYLSSNTGAPSVGTYNTIDRTVVLDGVLVNGYNSLTVTSITRSGTTATLTISGGHGFTIGVPARATISGANETDYNGTFNVTATSTTVLTYTVANNPATPATGTISCKRAAAGWTKSFSGTRLGTYRMGGGAQFYFAADETAYATYFHRYRGFESATAVGVAAASGTNPFPLDAQASGGAYFNTSNSTSTPTWAMLASDRTFYYFEMWTTAGNAAGMGFGEFETYRSGDAYNVFLASGCVATNTSAVYANEAYNGLTQNITSAATATTTDPSSNPLMFVARNYLGTAGASTVGKGTESFRSGQTTTSNTGSLTYPSYTESAIVLAPYWLSEGSNGVRGRLPGLWHLCHANRPLAHGTVFSGVTGSDLEGKVFYVHHVGNTGTIVLEISNTW